MTPLPLAETATTTTAISNNRRLHVALCAVPMFGHFVAILPYVEELLRRGHSVTIFHESDDKYRNKIEQCGFLDNNFNCESVSYDCGKDDKKKKWGDPIYDRILSHYSNDDDDSNKKTKPVDVMVYDFFAVDAADAADKLGVPAVAIFPNPRSINPWAATPSEQTTLQWTLFWSTFCYGMEAVLARILWCMRAKSRWSRSLPILREQDLYPSPYMPRPIIGSMSPLVEYPNLPPAPLYHMVGPSLPTCSNTNPLPKDLQDWMEAQEMPIVYVAFGTMYKHTPESVRQLEQDLLKADVAVLWSLPKKDQTHLLYNRKNKKKKDSKMRVESFLPQVALLQSGKISAFVTHCGSNSMNESLLAGVPMICCPRMADQPANASRLARAGVGIIAKAKNNKNKGRGVGKALQELLDNLEVMTQTSQELAQKLQSMNGAQHGANLIEEIVHEKEYYNKLVMMKGGPSRWHWWPLPIILAATLPMLSFL